MGTRSYQFLNSSDAKIKVQVFGGSPHETLWFIHACGETVIKLSVILVYLASVVNNNGGPRQYVLRRIVMAYGVMDWHNASIWSY